MIRAGEARANDGTDRATSTVRAAARAFVDNSIGPFAQEFEALGGLPDDVVDGLASHGYLGALIPEAHGGHPMTFGEFGVLNEELGRGCSSTRSLVTVQSMVSRAVVRWGSEYARTRWLPQLASGQAIAALAVTEPAVGSNIAAVETEAHKDGPGWKVTGEKVWVSFGRRADVYLVLARSPHGTIALLVDRGAAGLSIRPRDGQLGLRAAEVADLSLSECHVPPESVVGSPGFGVAIVVNEALTVGRYSVAWGCVGIGQAALEGSCSHAGTRVQFGQPIAEHQLVRRMLTNMAVEVEAARLHCEAAGMALDTSRVDAVERVMMAKYYASGVAARAASDAVQLHGSSGCASDAVAQRLYRDAKVMQIIEGSDEVNQVKIAEYALRRFVRGDAADGR